MRPLPTVKAVSLFALAFLLVFLLLLLAIEMVLLAPIVCLALAVAMRYAAVVVSGRRSAEVRRARAGVEGDPTSPYAHFRLAKALHAKGSNLKAVRHFRNCIQLDPSLDVRSPHETARTLCSSLAKSDDEENFVQIMTYLSCMDYIAEELRRMPVSPGALIRIARQNKAVRKKLISDCAQATAVLQLQIDSLMTARDIMTALEPDERPATRYERLKKYEAVEREIADRAERKKVIERLRKELETW